MSLIYKILGRREWGEALKSGTFEGSSVDRVDGFIHFSTAGQVAETMRRHFAGRGALTVLEVESESLGAALRWEPARDGSLFPHLYGPLECARVITATNAQTISGTVMDLGDRPG